MGAMGLDFGKVLVPSLTASFWTHGPTVRQGGEELARQWGPRGDLGALAPKGTNPVLGCRKPRPVRRGDSPAMFTAGAASP